MSREPMAFGTFQRQGPHIFRVSAYLQWGDSEESLGAVLLLNPGAAMIDRAANSSFSSLGDGEKVSGPLRMDRTMRQLTRIVDGICAPTLPHGRLRIYNLFTLRHGNSREAIDTVHKLIDTGQYDLYSSLPQPSELRMHPWLLIGWGLDKKASWPHLAAVRAAWLNCIAAAGIRSFGKSHPRDASLYYFPSPLLQSAKDAIVQELVAIYRQTSR